MTCLQKNISICLVLAALVGSIYLRPIYLIVGNIEAEVATWGMIVIVIAGITALLPYKAVKIIGLGLISILNLLPAISWFSFIPLTDSPAPETNPLIHIILGLIHLSISIYSLVCLFLILKDKSIDAKHV